jgi:hypothetical protein
MKKGKVKQNKKDGKFLEHTIEVLEHSISPEAKVERDVWLPNLISKISKKRQCDIVIRTGKPPRETITIVEVQDRIKKTSIGEFDGWVTKMKAVGAQHLICVSRHKFSDSIREKALQSGTTIRLMTFCDDPNKIPQDFISPHINIRYPIYKSLSYINLFITNEFDKLNSDGLNLDTKIFQVNNDFLSLNDFIDGALSSGNFPEDCPKLDIKLGKGTASIFNATIENKIYDLDKIEFHVELEYDQIDVPISIITYEQEASGAIAWMLEGRVIMNEEEVIIKIPVHKVDNGFYEIRAFSIPNKFRQSLLNFSFKSEAIRS